MISMPRGTHDYPPSEALLLRDILTKAESVFRRFGFSPLVTPALESNDVLSAKSYGEEATTEFFEVEGEEAGLRYDLTVPMSRFVAQNRDLPMPFKRYEIGAAWRKEEPQRMRYREFYQADVDIVGTSEVASDAEVIAACATVLDELGINGYVVHLNSRIILNSMLEMFGVAAEKRAEVMRALDKLYKLGSDAVKAQLVSMGLSGQQADEVLQFISAGDEESKSEKLASFSATAKTEIERMNKLVELVKSYGTTGDIAIDFSIVRGINYYTSFVWEFVAEKDGKRLPSIVAGGRYDNLIGMLAGKGKPLPATGSSLGISRIFDMLYQETGIRSSARAFVAHAKPADFPNALKAANELRALGINAEVEVAGRALSKQLEYAASLGIPFVVIVGEAEVKQGKLRLRDMSTGSEELLSIDELAKKVA
ncbi:MAG: histidine--tRNA ligase [Candidatus Micrarchaeia archaeon]